MNSDQSTPVQSNAGVLSQLIFASRWLQAPLYMGLIIAQAVYVYQFVLELWHIVQGVFGGDNHMGEAEIMLGVLGLVDVVMISNLLIMVIVGGYETFVSRMRLQGHPDQPEWLDHVNENALKTKLAMSIIGISSIHLLRTFISSGQTVAGLEQPTTEDMMWQTIIHMAFVLSAIALAFIDRLTQSMPAHAAKARNGNRQPTPDVDAPLG